MLDADGRSRSAVTGRVRAAWKNAAITDEKENADIRKFEPVSLIIKTGRLK